MYKREKSYWLKHLDFIVGDLLILEIVYFMAVFVRSGRFSVDQVKDNSVFAVVMVFIFLLVGICTEAYSGILWRGYYKEFAAVVKEVLAIMIVVSLYFFITQSGLLHSRLVWLIWGCVSLILIYLYHLIRKKQIHKRSQEPKKGEAASKMIVFATDDNIYCDLERLTAHSCYEEYEVIGAVVVNADLRGQVIEGVPVVGYRSDALEYVKKNVVDEVFLHFTDLCYLQKNLMEYFQGMGIAVHVCISESVPGKAHNKIIEDVGGFTVVSNSIVIASPVQLFLKRALDIMGGLVGTLLTGVIFVIFAPIIYIQSPGPIFFTQTRIGRNGRRFKIYKFRSMYMDAEERKKELMEQNKMKGFMFKIDDDPRIIPIGRFMRAASLDEFPQFFNVLKGEMSLVGTRPPTEDEYALYEDYHKRRLATRPGITGMWQVSGRSDITDFEEVVALDSKYIENWNIGKDIRILFKTIAVVANRKGSV